MARSTPFASSRLEEFSILREEETVLSVRQLEIGRIVEGQFLLLGQPSGPAPFERRGGIEFDARQEKLDEFSALFHRFGERLGFPCVDHVAYFPRRQVGCPKTEAFGQVRPGPPGQIQRSSTHRA